MRRKDKYSIHLSYNYRKRYFLFLLFGFMMNTAFSQLHLDFNDNNLHSVVWTGDINHFKINTSGQLQLSAPGAGESSIFTKYNKPKDSIQVDLYFKMQFDPSNDNMAKIYLFLSKPSEANADGYYLKLGENGSNDAIQLYKLTAGVPILMGSGVMGAIAKDPAQARLRIKIFEDGFGIMATDYKGGELFNTDLEFYDSEFNLQDSLYFGIYCKYTSSRADKFYFDDIHIQTIQRDTIAPRVVSAIAIDNHTVKIQYSEPPFASTAISPSVYSIDHGIGQPESVYYTIGDPLNARLAFAEGTIKSGIEYRLTIDGLKDVSGNTEVHGISFLFTEKANIGDLVINEVLTDPATGGEDFVEIYNPSQKFIALDSIILRNADRNENRVIRTDFVLKPGNYVAISKNVEFLKQYYQTPTEAAFIEATLPTLNVASANISLLSVINGRQITVDSFNYNQQMHFSLIKKTKGVSLERIKADGNTNDVNNWHSAASISNYGTPGYKNSNASTTNESEDDDFVTIDHKVFTPDSDGHKDFVLISYALEKSGYLATIQIYDVDGHEIRQLADNILMSQATDIQWDGLDAEGSIVKTGMYIVYSKLFHPDGETKYSKKVVVAAKKF